MAEIKVMKIDTDGTLVEHTGSADDLTMNQFTVDGGLVASATGIDMNNTSISDADGVSFTDPATDGITQTAGVLAANNLMGKDRENLMASTGSVTFPGGIGDTAGEVDAFRLPSLAGVPSATPTNGGEGHLVWNSASDTMYAWDGAAWKNLSVSSEAQKTCNEYTNGNAGALAAGDVVYISAADTVDKADVSGGGAASRVIGIAGEAITSSAVGKICSEGVIGGLTGLTAGSRYYADPATPGGLTATVPTGSGNTLVQIGYAKNATTIHLQIAQLGRRS